MQIDENTAAAHDIHGHQHHYFNTFLQLYDIRGKDILEVGGAMPAALVLDHLGAGSWTAVQSAEYAQHRSDNQVPRGGGEGGGYRAVYANVEDLRGNPDFTEKFDAVFSIACFEHIHKLPQALDSMYRALRPGGRLFSMYAPIWSGPWGQHYTDAVPERFKPIEPPGGWTTQHIFGPWDHLLLSRFQFFEQYAARFDSAYAEELTYLTYNSPQINRYFFEDYENFIGRTKFQKVVFQGVFTFPDSEATRAVMQALRERHAGSGYRNFSDSGILAFLGK